MKRVLYKITNFWQDYLELWSIILYAWFHPYKIMEEREEQEIRLMQFQNEIIKLRRKNEQLEAELMLEISENGDK